MPTCPLPPIFPPKKCFSHQHDEGPSKRSPTVAEMGSGFLPDLRWGRSGMMMQAMSPAVYSRLSPPPGVHGQRKILGPSMETSPLPPR